MRRISSPCGTLFDGTNLLDGIFPFKRIHLSVWCGLLNEVAILLFIVMTIYSIRKSLSGK